MTSLGTDFEMHAIWQGYVEDPAAKDFVAKKARTIALSKAQGTQQSTLFTSLEIPWGFQTRAVLCRCDASLGGTLDYIPNPTLRLMKRRVFTFGALIAS
jgi:hypothetical protein